MRKWLWFWRRQRPQNVAIIIPTSIKGETLNTFEYNVLATQCHCPDCGAEVLAGPIGGISINVACVGCGSEFNLTPAINTAERNSTRGEPNLSRLLKIFGIRLYRSSQSVG